MKTYMELLDIIYSPCIYFLYIFHVAYAIELAALAYMKTNSIAANFIYHRFQLDMRMRDLLILRIGIWIVLLALDSTDQARMRIASTCEPSFSGSILLVLSIAYCTKLILDNRKRQE